MKKSLIGAALISFMPFANAANIDKLVTISNDRTAITSDLDLVLDANATVTGFAYLTNDAGKIAEKDFALAVLKTADGAVLEEQQGVKAVQLKGTVDSAKGTGALVIHYVNNGLTGAYKDCNANLARNANGVWTMVNAYNGKTVTAAKIMTSALGIDTIQGICP